MAGCRRLLAAGRPRDADPDRRRAAHGRYRDVQIFGITRADWTETAQTADPHIR